jgi:hypothetical protein
MTFLLVISLLFSSSQFDLIDDVVCEYSRLEFADLKGTSFQRTLIPYLGNNEIRRFTNYCANESSSELNRLFYRCPRDCLIRTHGD